MDTPRANDEIDLVELTVRVFRFFQRYFWLFVICTVGGVGAGAALYSVVPDIYVSKMVIQSDILTESYSDRITESIDNLIDEGNYALLSQRLGLTTDQAEKLRSIEIESIKETKEQGKEESIFIITAEALDKSIITTLQDGIISYLRNNEFVKIRVQQRIEYYEKLILSIGEEIQSLDTLKQKLLAGKPIYGKSAGDMMLIDPTNIYDQIINLKRQQLEYRNALQLANSIQLVEGFTIYEKPAEPKLSVAMAVGFALGFFAALAVVFVRWVSKTAETFPA
ncbi:MAG: hypothetical protein MUC38_10330 [Cyclobacteriaceae bacterium]|jgi:hypothetical protein|nr:hypothetical protein [Cyclobacteriaceae bacterium]